MNEPTKRSVEQQIRDGLNASRQDGFAAGFEERALSRWKAERAAVAWPTTLSLIEYRAQRLLPLAVAASLILAVYSARAGTDSNQQSSIVARALGWSTSGDPSRSSDLFESIYGLPQSESPVGGR
ncbi:MAG: hypothetical protein ABJB66_12200 [Gemmatimonadaceae bacterium]